MPGPLPTPTRRRRNQPTLPTTVLPSTGRAGPAPAVPSWVELGNAGTAWWRWAWATPQATRWDPGSLSAVARRASLEDDLAVMGHVESLDLAKMLDAGSEREFKTLIRRLAGLAGGRLAVLGEMRQLDDRLGLTPKSMGQMRWSIGDEEEQEPGPVHQSTVRRLRMVDPNAVARA